MSKLLLGLRYSRRFLAKLSEIQEKMIKEGSVVILSGVRTPIGSFRGSLSSESAVQLGAIVIQQAIKAASSFILLHIAILPEKIDEVYMGHSLQAGCKQLPARQAALLGGCPVKVDCTSINKVCASSLKAVTLAAQAILTKTDKFVVTGGMESMSNAPFLVSREVPAYGGAQLMDSITYDTLTCSFNQIHMGECCEKLAEKYGITRLEQDEYATMAYKRALSASKNGMFKDEIVYVPITNKKTGAVVKIFEDEEIKKFNPEKMAKISSAFIPDGTITAANASKLSDGASALVLTSKDEAKRLALEPIAKIISFADAACDPVDFGLAPVHAIRKALALADINISDVSMFEINEAFSVVPLVCMRELKLDHSIVNIHGGAVSLGHPVGASGARILTHLIHALEPHQVGVAAICNGGGAATAVVVVKFEP
ncbi:hypothetical protein MXB_910 [Myxobolus squamalis]|nr:hypothetical protein MXB_910 [Myxobolus squamalis]